MTRDVGWISPMAQMTFLILRSPVLNVTFAREPTLSAVDLETNAIVPFIHPPSESWSDHFLWHGLEISRSLRDRQSYRGLAAIEYPRPVASAGIIVPAQLRFAPVGFIDRRMRRC